MPRPEPLATVAGAGFIALDILLPGSQDRQFRRRAGGTCGNVLAILSFLGHTAVPIARLGTDEAADCLISDLKSAGVDCQHVQRDPLGRTPRVVEFLPGRRGNSHRFGFTCPECQRRFPRRSEPIYEQGNDSIQKVNPGLFFFDRSGPTTTRLATEAREQGALVMFEPDSLGTNSNFFEALQLSDVVKYSGRRTRQSIEPWLRNLERRPSLVIETMDGDGLRYMGRRRLSELTWKHQEPYLVESPVDQAGAGDWCSAGLISRLLATTSSERWRERTVERALAFGQSLAAASILFEGPRGYLEKSSRQEVLRASVSTVRRGRLPDWIAQDTGIPGDPPGSEGVDGACAFCLAPLQGSRLAGSVQAIESAGKPTS